MNRPIVVFAIGTIIGIIGGLYLEGAISIFLIGILVILFFKNRYRGYLKILMPFSMCILLLASVFLSVYYINFHEKRYGLIKEGQTEELVGIIQSEAIEKEYVLIYTVQIKKIETLNNVHFRLYVAKGNDNKIYHYGDKIHFRGKIEIPSKSRNRNGFNQELYYKTKGWYGAIYVNPNQIKKIGQENNFWSWGNRLRNSFEQRLKTFLTEDNANLLMAILTGEKENISDKLIQDFQNSSLIHILCVSGGHISFFILGTQKLLEKIGRKKKHLISILILIGLNCITGFSASVMRASIMAALIVSSKLCFRQNDLANSIALSLIILLIHNPFLLFDTGLLLSYTGTIGIILFANLLEGKRLEDCGKLTAYFGKIAFSACAAQILLAPIIAYIFQKFYPTFLISNILATPLFEMILILGCFFLFSSYIFPPICYCYSFLLNLLLNSFSKIAEVSANFSFSYVYMPKPNIFLCLFYYFFIFFIRFIYMQRKNALISCYRQKKMIRIIQILKKLLNFKNVVLCLISLVIINICFKLIPGSLKINFIDVGQGDCTLIRTGYHKNIMIDSGGAEGESSYDVGEKVVVPYLLSNGITQLDFIIISHFHSDHCRGFQAVLKAIRVKAMLIAKQEIYNEDAKALIKLAKEKKVKIYYVETGQVIKLDRETSLEILYVGRDNENLNNNSILARLVYGEFKMFFTGDAEEEEEREFLEKYENREITANILKIGHHGSSTSTSQEFLKKINPSIGLIGVGKKNTFGHPSLEIINRLQEYGCQIYRTDKSGEIAIEVKKSNKIKIEEYIE